MQFAQFCSRADELDLGEIVDIYDKIRRDVIRRDVIFLVKWTAIIGLSSYAVFFVVMLMLDH
jgi:hypothetical protein